MDPALSLAEWDAAIETAANGQRLTWRRGELREKDIPMLGTRIACKPVLDIMHNVEAFVAKTDAIKEIGWDENLKVRACASRSPPISNGSKPSMKSSPVTVETTHD
jgi:hypothetical protein